VVAGREGRDNEEAAVGGGEVRGVVAGREGRDNEEAAVGGGEVEAGYNGQDNAAVGAVA
jgi:hypothetical protein